MQAVDLQSMENLMISTEKMLFNLKSTQPIDYLNVSSHLLSLKPNFVAQKEKIQSISEYLNEYGSTIIQADGSINSGNLIQNSILAFNDLNLINEYFSNNNIALNIESFRNTLSDIFITIHDATNAAIFYDFSNNVNKNKTAFINFLNTLHVQWLIDSFNPLFNSNVVESDVNNFLMQLTIALNINYSENTSIDSGSQILIFPSYFGSSIDRTQPGNPISLNGQSILRNANDLYGYLDLLSSGYLSLIDLNNNYNDFINNFVPLNTTHHASWVDKANEIQSFNSQLSSGFYSSNLKLGYTNFIKTLRTKGHSFGVNCFKNAIFVEEFANSNSDIYLENNSSESAMLYSSYTMNKLIQFPKANANGIKTSFCLSPLKLNLYNTVVFRAFVNNTSLKEEFKDMGINFIISPLESLLSPYDLV